MSLTSSKNELMPYMMNVPNKISITIKKSTNKMEEALRGRSDRLY